jgi:hypothetical protein
MNDVAANQETGDNEDVRMNEANNSDEDDVLLTQALNEQEKNKSNNVTKLRDVNSLFVQTPPPAKKVISLFSDKFRSKKMV